MVSGFSGKTRDWRPGGWPRGRRPFEPQGPTSPSDYRTAQRSGPRTRSVAAEVDQFGSGWASSGPGCGALRPGARLITGGAHPWQIACGRTRETVLGGGLPLRVIKRSISWADPPGMTQMDTRGGHRVAVRRSQRAARVDRGAGRRCRAASNDAPRRVPPRAAARCARLVASVAWQTLTSPVRLGDPCACAARPPTSTKRTSWRSSVSRISAGWKACSSLTRRSAGACAGTRRSDDRPPAATASVSGRASSRPRT